jgi:hypothetical protein
MKQQDAPPASSVLSPIRKRELALKALVDDRTFNRALRGEPIRDLSRERIVRVLAEAGLLGLLP